MLVARHDDDDDVFADIFVGEFRVFQSQKTNNSMLLFESGQWAFDLLT